MTNAVLCAREKYSGDTSKSRLSLPWLRWLSSFAEEPLLKVKRLVKPAYLLCPKSCLFFSAETASKDVNLKRFCFLVLDGFFSCEVETYPLGIALGNSYFYTDCQRVVSS